jgi:hypothetical protein
MQSRITKDECPPDRTVRVPAAPAFNSKSYFKNYFSREVGKTIRFKLSVIKSFRLLVLSAIISNNTFEITCSNAEDRPINKKLLHTRCRLSAVFFCQSHNGKHFAYIGYCIGADNNGRCIGNIDAVFHDGQVQHGIKHRFIYR